MRKLVKKILRSLANYDPTYYDMYEDANEAFFAKVYLERIKAHLFDARIEPPARLLDAGCQTGRLSIPLAKNGFSVTGIDTSGFALRRALRHSSLAGASIRWRKADIVDFLSKNGRSKFDAIICTEVLYLQRDYKLMLDVMANALGARGLLFVSHRSKGYCFLDSLRRGNLRTARQVLSAQEGIFDGPFPEAGYYNWQTENELKRLYNALGLELIAVYPIDRFTWLTGLSPAKLSPSHQKEWLQLELEADSYAKMYGRYLLAVATNRHGC